MDVPTLEQLDGQVAVVTGANRGLGAEVARQLAERGARVFAGARTPTTLTGVEALSEGRIRPLPLDVTDETSVADAIDYVLEAAGRLDLVVNNAGIGDWHGSTLESLDAATLDEVLATNLRGPVLMAKHAVPHLLNRRGGRIVNVSSGMGGLDGMGGGSPAYRISKTALNGLTAYLHGEYGMRGLIAASVCPGWVRTDMGGANASRSVEEGAASILHACMLADGAPGGRFWRDGAILDW